VAFVKRYVVAPERIAITREFPEWEQIERYPSGINVERGEAVVMLLKPIGAASSPPPPACPSGPNRTLVSLVVLSELAIFFYCKRGRGPGGPLHSVV
jgi:hypothetical protein